MKFGRQMQNGMPMTIHRSKLKPEIEFQLSNNHTIVEPSEMIFEISLALYTLIHDSLALSGIT